MNLQTRRLLGAMSRIAYPFYSWCGHCNRTWNICEGHTTDYKYDERGFATWGCFPLCKDCWQELTIDERIPYYENLWKTWLEQGTDKSEDDHQAILKAVREGK